MSMYFFRVSGFLAILLMFPTVDALSCFPTPEYRAEGDHVIYGITYCGKMGHDVIQIDVSPSDLEIGASVFARHGTDLYIGGRLFPEINAKEVRLISNDYVKDSKGVYSLSGYGKQDVSDAGSFTYLGNGYYKDNVGVYFDTFQPPQDYVPFIRRHSLGLVHVDLNPRTAFLEHDFAADGKNLYCYNKMIAQGGSYELFDEYALVGSKVFFCGQGRLEVSSISTSPPLRRLTDYYFKDTRRVYYAFVPISGADPVTFRTLGKTYWKRGGALCYADSTGWAVDKANIYLSGTKVPVVDKSGRKTTFDHLRIHLMPEPRDAPVGTPSDALGYMEDGNSRFVIQSDNQGPAGYLIRYTGRVTNDAASGKNLPPCDKAQEQDPIRSTLPEDIFADPRVLGDINISELGSGIFAKIIGFVFHFFKY